MQVHKGEQNINRVIVVLQVKGRGEMKESVVRMKNIK